MTQLLNYLMLTAMAATITFAVICIVKELRKKKDTRSRDAKNLRTLHKFLLEKGFTPEKITFNSNKELIVLLGKTSMARLTLNIKGLDIIGGTSKGEEVYEEERKAVIDMFVKAETKSHLAESRTEFFAALAVELLKFDEKYKDVIRFF